MPDESESPPSTPEEDEDEYEDWDLTWTEQRLQALYQRFNRRYWNGELPRYKVKIKNCRHCDGFVHHRSSTIAIDIINHYGDDKEVRLTLLHEMVHVAVLDSPAHGLAFWREVNRILGMGAPPDLVLSYPRQLRRIMRTNSDGFPLVYCIRAVREMDARAQRLRRWERESDLECEHLETVSKFRDVVENLTWTQAWALIGPETDLVDESGKPRSPRHAELLAFIKKLFQRERRWHQRYAAKRRGEERLARALREYQSQLAAEQTVGQP